MESVWQRVARGCQALMITTEVVLQGHIGYKFPGVGLLGVVLLTTPTPGPLFHDLCPIPPALDIKLLVRQPLGDEPEW